MSGNSIGMTTTRVFKMITFEATQLWDKRAMGYLWAGRKHYDPTQITHLDALFKNRKKCKNGQTVVKYALTNDKVGQLGYGRLYGSIGSLEWIQKDIRATLAHEFYDDVDMVNCHPTLAVKLGERFSLPMPTLNSYVRDRDGFLNRLGINPSDGKTLVCALLNGKAVPNEYKNTPDIVAIKAEAKELCIELIKCGDHLELYEHLKNISEEKPNTDGSFISAILQREERKCLEIMVGVLQSNGFIVDVLAYDGAMVRKNDKKPITNAILRLIEAQINADLGYDMKIKIKPMTDLVIPMEDLKDDNVVADDVIITEKFASEKYIEMMGADIVKQDGVVYIYNKENGLWVSGDDNIHHSLIKHADKLVFYQYKEGVMKTYVFAQSAVSLNSIKTYVKNILSNSNFIRDSIIRSKGCLLFADGWYDMKEEKFYEGFGSECREKVFLKRIKYNFPKVVNAQLVDTLYKTLFLNPYNSPQDGEFYAHIISRALAGHVEDKQVMMIVGNPNCGKSTTSNMMKVSFDEYVGSFNMNSLKFNKNTADEAKKMSWIMPLAGCRILCGSEVRMDGYSLDGNLIKSLSGNDPLIVRCNFKDESVFIMTATIFGFMNDIPPISPADEALKNRFVAVPHTKSFVNKPQSECNEYEMSADPTLDEKIKTPEYRDAYTHIILKAYRKGIRLPKPSSVVDEINELLPIEAGMDLKKKLAEEFEFVPSTPEGEDNFVEFDRVFRYLKEKGCKSSPTLVGRELRKLGLKKKDKKVNKRTCTVYYGLKESS
jgi:hypothetical protein